MLARRGIAPAVAMLIALFLAACGGGSSSPGPSPTSAATRTPSLPPSPTPSATALPEPSATGTSPSTVTRTPSSAPSASSTPTPTREPTATDTAAPTATLTPLPPPSATPTVADACGTDGTICTVAGTGLSQFDGDGRPALQTSFYYPLDIEFDGEGRALILDWNNLRLRRLNHDGTIQTVMGNDLEAFPVDGARAVDTSLHHPTDFERDADGNLYVAGNHVPVVFRVNTEDRVFTVAGSMAYGNDGDGGPALSATLSEPYGVLPDGEGGFFLSDATANVIRHVDVGGIIRRIAGTGQRGYAGDGGPAIEAQLDGPTRLQRNIDGDLYFCDTDNHVVRRVREGQIATVAGTGAAGFAGDGGPASEAQLDSPYDLRFSPAGNLYVADTGNHAVRRVDGDGRITTVVGTGAEGFAGDGGDARDARLDGPSGLNFGADGSLWIADTFNQRVRRVAGFLASNETPGPTRTRRPTSPPTSTPTRTPTGVPPEDAIVTVAGTGESGFGGDGGPATEAQLSSPVEVVVRPSSGEVVIVDFGNHRVRSIDPETGFIRTLAGSGETSGEGALPFPTDIVFAADGSFFVSSWGTSQVYQYFVNGTRRVVAGNGIPVCDGDEVPDPLAGSLRLPRSLQITRNGSVLISEQGCHRIRLLTPTGMRTFAGTGQAGYAGDGGSPEEAQFSSRTSPLRPIPNFGIALSPEQIADELFVADSGNNAVREIRLLADRIDTFAGTGEAGFVDDAPRLSELDRPAAVFVSSDHALWFSDAGNHAVRRVDPLRIGVTTLAGTGQGGYNGDERSASGAQLNNPGGICVTAERDVYVADTDNHRVRRFRFNR